MENRLKLFYDVSSHLFINKGYSRTQMKDIARAAGLSTGMMYQYFTGKRDILSFILKATISPDLLDQELEFPVSSGLFSNINQELQAAFEENRQGFGHHLDSPAADYPLAEMLSDAFAVISNYGIGCLIIEHNPNDLTELADYYRRYRRSFFEQVQAYVRIYIARGEFRKVESEFYASRFIIETLAFWGMHIANDAFEPDQNISPEDARNICLDNLLHAFQA